MNPLVAMVAMAIGFLTDAVAATLDGCELALYQNDITPTQNSLLADFTVATYTGYTVESVTWLPPSQSDDGNIEVVGTVPEFRPTGTTTTNMIYGCLLLDGTGALLAACKFTNGPKPMTTTLQTILPVIRIRTNPLGGFVVDVD